MESFSESWLLNRSPEVLDSILRNKAVSFPSRSQPAFIKESRRIAAMQYFIFIFLVNFSTVYKIAGTPAISQIKKAAICGPFQ
jgi:hypothetical protein